MRTSLVRRDAPLDRRKAWACLLLNVGACPGFGSILAGRLSGWPQLGLSLAGFVWSVWTMGRFLMLVLKAGHVPDDWRKHALALAAGFGVFAVSWLWSGITGLLLLKGARRES